MYSYYVIVCFCCSFVANTHSLDKVFCVSHKNSTSNDQVCQGYNFTENNTLSHYMLSHYMHRHDDYFKSNQTYVFDQGRHMPLINFTLNISNTSNLSLIGSKKAEAAIIDCSGQSTGFLFQFFLNIIISDLTFVSCHIHKHKGPSAILVFLDGLDLHLLSVKLMLSVDQAFDIKDTYGDVVLNDIEVSHTNTAGKKREKAGNAITYQHCNSSQTSDLSIINSTFMNNSNFISNGHHVQLYAAGLSINLECPNIRVVIDNVTMSNNTGGTGGNLALYFYTTQSFFNVSIAIFNSRFEGGNAAEGAGMFALFVMGLLSQGACERNHQDHLLFLVSNTTFNNNIAQFAGGGIYLKQKQSLSSCSRENMKFVNVMFSGNLVVKANSGGVAFHSINFMVTDYLHHKMPQYYLILTNCSICNNHVKKHNVDSSGTGTVFTKSNHFFKLENTAIINNTATGLLGMSSNVILSHNITIINNTGSSGGGILLCQNAVMYLEAYTNVTIAYNIAYHTGGGICVETDYLESKPICFFQIGRDPLFNSKLTKTINITLHNNYAGFAGDNIFGGSIDYCYMIDSPRHKANRSIAMYEALFTVPSNEYSLSSVTSPPRYVCACHNDKPVNCYSNSSRHTRLHLFPGEPFQLEFAVVGQHQGTVPGAVQATLKHNNSRFEGNKKISVQSIKDTRCKSLQYTIYTSQYYEVVELKVQQFGYISEFAQSNRYNRYFIKITIKECPLGFTVNGSCCDCNSLLKQLGDRVTCSIKNQTIQKVPPTWIGYVQSTDGSIAVAYHEYCPFDYCKNSVVEILVTNETLSEDIQCAHNRTGVMCGSCSAGLSVVMGSSECRYCSHYWLLLNIPIAIIGVLVIFLLTVLNITIAEGTLSGLIFYCNVVWNNYSIFFPGRNITIFTVMLEMFLSLINLDSKISLCFFDGMDAYSKIWLQFGFPLYLWLITGILVLLGGRCSWIVRRNVVKVMATLILLAYARLLTSVTKALQVSYVHVRNGNYEQRWLIDGNVHYFKGKHIPLALFAALVSVFLFLFSLCLFFIQCLLKVSHLRAFSWVNYFKPVIDAYTGPFTSGGRFWTGLLLLLRILIFIASAVNTSGNPRVMLSIISIAVICLLCIIWILPAGLYRRRKFSTLECAFLLNLGVLSSLLLIYTEERHQSMIVSTIFVTISQLMFFGIIFYHIARLKPIRTCIFRCCYCIRMRYNRQVEMTTSTYFSNSDMVQASTFPPYQPFNEDREPLLAMASDHEYD